jgi:hypothetical protein
MANQDGWQFCRRCQGLYRGSVHRGGQEYALVGQCPASAKYGSLILHDSMQAPPYVLRVQGPNDKSGPQTGMQFGWKCCKKCQGLFFANNPDPGACPAGGKHDGSQNPTLGLRMGGQGVGGMHTGWRWCRKCQGMFCSVFEPGVCPAGGAHDATQSGQYFMRLDNPSPPDHIEFDWPSIVLDGVAVGGSSHLSLASDGTCTLAWSFHDSGAFEYNVSLAWFVKDCWNQIYTATHDGSVHGTFEAGSRDDRDNKEFHDWRVKDNWADLAVGASAEGHASASMDGWNIVNNTLALGLGIAGIVLAVMSLGGAAAGAGAGAAVAAGAGQVKK